MPNALKRARGVDPRVFDALLTAAMVIGGIVELSILARNTADALFGALGVVSLLTLYVRRARPTVPAVVISATALLTAIFSPHLMNTLTTPFLAFMIIMYSLGRYLPAERRSTVWGLAVIAGVTLDSGVSGGFTQPTDVVWAFLLGGGPFLAGRAMANRQRLQTELWERTRELESEGARLAEHAVENERIRIAGELQGVVANGVSAMVVQAEAVPRLLEARDSARAEEALVRIEETGRDALTEMRRLLGVLRRDGEGPSLVPLPTLAEVERLAEAARDEGLAVDLRIAGERVALAPGADLAAYRVLQEALMSAAAGGASNADVTIDFEDDELRLAVRDDRPEAELDPEPLAAMRERLGLYGGRIRAERSNGAAGFQVRARMPIEGASR